MSLPITALLALVVAAPPPRSPVAPEASLALLCVAPGFKVELAAAEPQVVDPIHVVFDENERMWVVEMGDYPLGPRPGEEPRGRIRILDDADGDGRFEKSTLFADGLRFPTGAAPWKGGVYVTTQREVLYLADADGDGRADRRDVVFEGFLDENTQLLPNHPTWCIDNRIYFANGLRATDVRRPGGGDAPVLSIRGRDFRFDPLRGSVEPVSGMSQFGMAFDDEGERFLCSNRNHIQHVVIDEPYASRNPRFALRETIEDIPDHGAAAQIFPLSRNWTTSNLHAGTFTAACGVCIYRGDLLEAVRGDAFVCDPTGNLVHHDRLRSTGSTFVAGRVEEGADFLASPDEWFRPVNLAVGSDGALYVVDMYRAVIEHPQWVPAEEQNRPDQMSGDDRGRIYRIIPDGGRSPHPRDRTARLAGAGTDRLVAALSDANGWRRDTAQRLLVERQDLAAVPELEKLSRHGPDPLGQLHSLWTLEGLGKLEPALVTAALGDADPRVRRAALRLAEPRLPGNEALRARALELSGDPDRGVRFQLALGTGAMDAAATLAPLARIVRQDDGDRWLRAAVLTSVCEKPVNLLVRLHEDGAGAGEGRLELARDLARLAGSSGHVKDSEAVLLAAGKVQGPHAARWKRACAIGLLEGVRGPWAESPEARQEAESVLREATRDAQAESLSIPERLEAVRLLSRALLADAAPVLEGLIDASTSPELRAAAARSLGAHDDPKAADALLSRWPASTPQVRRAMADVLLARPASSERLIEAIDAGRVIPTEIEPAERMRLLQHPDPAIKARAEKALARPGEDRALVVARYKECLQLPADVERGRNTFQKTCATCHRVDEAGVDTGPDISDTRERSPESLLTDILDPNRAIDGRYVSYTVTTKDGRVLSGVIASETATAMTLRRAEGQTDTLLRQHIAQVASSGLSLMPEGVEKDLSPQDMANLIRFLKTWRYTKRDAPGGNGRR